MLKFKVFGRHTTDVVRASHAIEAMREADVSDAYRAQCISE